MVVIRLANLLVVIFRENDPKSDIFNIEDLFLSLEYSHRFQRKNCVRSCLWRRFVFADIFCTYDDTIYQDMFRKNDQELEIFIRKGPIFFQQNCFLDHIDMLSEKVRSETS